MKVDGDNVVLTLANANADLPLLLSDYHLVIQPNGGRDAPDAGIGTGPYKVEENDPGVRHSRPNTPTIGATMSASSTPSKSSS